MLFLTSAQLKARLIDLRFEDAVKICEEGRWHEMTSRIGIYPFRQERLGTVVYDLSVGSEAYCFRKGEKMAVSKEVPLRLEPGETVLVLTEEYLVVGPKHAGLVLARARIMGEGVAQTSARIDPTWYGRLHVALTNHTNALVRLRHG